LEEAPDIPVSGGQEEHVQKKERRAKLRRALRTLTPLQQQVIALRFLEELTIEETGEVVRRSQGAVKGIQFRALRSLRRILEEDNGE
jgi:RNA polymerase sigma-70 factor (ECF subfamily)